MATGSPHNWANDDGDRPGDKSTVRALDTLDGPATSDWLQPALPPLARRYYPDLRRLARTYRVGAWISLVAGPLIGAMSLSANLEGVGRLLWTFLVVVATGFMFVTWRATSELILAVLRIADGVSQVEHRTRRLEGQLTNTSDGKRDSSERTPRKRRKSKGVRAPRRAKQEGAEESLRMSA